MNFEWPSHSARVRLALVVATLGLPSAGPLIAQEGPPQLLQVYRDPLRPGREAAFDAVERDAARSCAQLDFPNPHLAMESLTGPKEVWWLNAFASEADRQRVTSAYKANAALVAALEGIGTRRQGLTDTPVDLLTTYRADLSQGVAWEPAGARFVVVAVTRQNVGMKGAVFAAPDGTRYVFRTMRTRQQAEAEAAAAGPEAKAFAVRPQWGMPAKAWIDADPEFWKVNPMARRRSGPPASSEVRSPSAHRPSRPSSCIVAETGHWHD